MHAAHTGTSGRVVGWSRLRPQLCVRLTMTARGGSQLVYLAAWMHQRVAAAWHAGPVDAARAVRVRVRAVSVLLPSCTCQAPAIRRCAPSWMTLRSTEIWLLPCTCAVAITQRARSWQLACAQVSQCVLVRHHDRHGCQQLQTRRQHVLSTHRRCAAAVWPCSCTVSHDVRCA